METSSLFSKDIKLVYSKNPLPDEMIDFTTGQEKEDSDFNARAYSNELNCTKLGTI